MKMHTCGFVCELAKDFYPETWAQGHAPGVLGIEPEDHDVTTVEVKRAIAVAMPEKTTVKDLKRVAKGMKIRCFNWMNREELVQCIADKNDGRTVAETEEAARVRSQEAWAQWRIKNGDDDHGKN